MFSPSRNPVLDGSDINTDIFSFLQFFEVKYEHVTTASATGLVVLSITCYSIYPTYPAGVTLREDVLCRGREYQRG
jgi:hypothetical protein